MSNRAHKYVRVVRDLSESEQQQRELAESEERSRLSRAAFEGIALLDEDRILDHSQALTNMLARGSENLLATASTTCSIPTRTP